MRVDPKALVRQLSPTATQRLEAAVGRSVTGEFEEIVPEHFLLSLLDATDGDVAAVFERYGVDLGRFALRVQKVLEGMRTGHRARPVFAKTLFQWVEDAWVLASIEYGDPRIRTGVLLAQFVFSTRKYTPESYPELDPIPRDALRKELPEILASSPESVELARAAGPAHGGGAAGAASTSESKEALDRFTTSFTALARAGRIDPVLGRHREVRQVIDILTRRRKNNPIIVGEPGVGKTALVEGLARAIAEGDVPDELREVDVRGLDLGALQAGSGVRGEFENRLKAVITEVKASATPIVLFIDEAHTLIGAGGPQGGGDAANLLKPALARGELRTIAATTWSEYKKYFEKDAALERRFQPVKVDEPSEAEAIAMLRGLAETYEKAHGVAIRDEAVVAAVRLSHRFITARQLPDKAVDLLDTAAARVKIEMRAKPEELAALHAEAATLERTVAALERDGAAGHAIDAAALAEAKDALASKKGALEALEARWSGERAAVEALMEARAEGGDVAAAAAALASVREKSSPLVHSEVDADVVARVVQSWTGVPVAKMQSDDIRAVLELEARLGERVRGQDHAIHTVAETIQMARAALNNPDSPLGVLLFVGTSGVGKTETALALADVLFGGDRFLTTINMSEFQEKHTVSRLIGSPPGYVGYGEGGVLSEAVRQKPYSVVLLDECEKADLDVLNLFYQVFDKGTLNDGEGRRIDFRNTVVILTSNLATDRIAELYADGTPSLATVQDAIRPILSRHFKPALLARMTVVPFAPMPRDVLEQITRLKVARIVTRLRAEHGTELDVGARALAEIADRCQVAETGARNVDHVLRTAVLPEVSKIVLEHLTTGAAPAKIAVDVDDGRRFTVRAVGA